MKYYLYNFFEWHMSACQFVLFFRFVSNKIIIIKFEVWHMFEWKWQKTNIWGWGNMCFEPLKLIIWVSSSVPRSVVCVFVFTAISYGIAFSLIKTVSWSTFNQSVCSMCKLLCFTVFYFIVIWVICSWS